MAEEHPQEAAHGGGDGSAEGHGAHAQEHDFDAMAHILDHVVVGLGKDGKLHWDPYDHEHQAKPGYEACSVGPFPLEFTRYMQDLTVVAVLLMAVSILVARRVRKNVENNEATKGLLANAVEAILEFIRDEVVKPVGGKHLVPFTPLLLSYFMLILACNYSGMVPWAFHGATASISVTGALGGSVLVLILALGMIKQGPLKFFVNLVPHGVPLLLWLPMFILELVGPIIKCLVLAVRLFANMIAGHLIVGNVLKMGIFGAAGKGAAIMGLAIGMPLAIGVSFLEVMVCFLQAYVFTMLATVFIGNAVHPDH